MTTFTLTAEVLRGLAKLNQFHIPKDELVFFGLRFAWPIHPEVKPTFRKSHELRLFSELEMEDRIFKLLSCTLVQWDTKTDELIVFPGSTIPEWNYIKNYIGRQGRQKANTLLTGCYTYKRHRHRGKYRAFGLARGKQPIHRYKVTGHIPSRFTHLGGFSGPDNIIEVSDPRDNIHAGSCNYKTKTQGGNTRYFSAGCSVIAGWGESPHWKKKFGKNWAKYGPYLVFVENGYKRVSQTRFQYILLNGSNASRLANSPQQAIGALRFGSRDGQGQDFVHQLQRKLNLGADGIFGPASFKALRKFQEANQLTPDGIAGPKTAAKLGIELPSL